MDDFEVLARSRDEFDRRLRAVTASDWSRSTPCSEWDVRALVNHVVGGCVRYGMMVRGASVEETSALRSVDHLGDDAVGSFAAAADEMTAAFREPGALARTVHHPAGDRSGAMLLRMRVVELGIHAWDLARAIGSDETLDPEVVSMLWATLSEMKPTMARGGYAAPPAGTPGTEGPLQERVLLLSGRQP